MLSIEEELAVLDQVDSLDRVIDILHECGKSSNLACANQMHLHVCNIGFQANEKIGNHLVPTFVKCGNVATAQQIFSRLPRCNEHAWTSLLQGYNEVEEPLKAIQLYSKMLEDGPPPSKFTFAALLKASAKLNCIESGQEIHAEITKKGLECDISVGNTLVDMYAKCGALPEALDVFNNLPLRNVITWTTVIAAFTDLGYEDEALKCSEQMELDGVSPNDVTFLSVLKACGSIRAVHKGQKVHSEIVENGFDTITSVCGSLVSLYAKCGLLEEAQEVFDELPVRGVVMWNTLMAGYAEQGLGKRVMSCLELMLMDNVTPDPISYICSLKACGTEGAAMDRGQEIHADIVFKGFEKDPSIGSLLVDLYAKLGCFAEAWQVFNNLKIWDVVSWTAIIAGFSVHGFHKEAISCVEQMKLEGVLPNPVTFIFILKACSIAGVTERGQMTHAEIVYMGLETDSSVCCSLINFYVDCDLLMEASAVFDGLPAPDIEVWNALIEGYLAIGLHKEASNLFQEMRSESVAPNAVTLLCNLKVCSCIGTLVDGQETHSEIAKWGFDTDLTVGNTLIDMYSRFGSSTEASVVFDMLPVRDVVSWTALIRGYVEHDLAEEVLRCIEQMHLEGVSADEVTFSWSLKACNSRGAIYWGREIHSEIIKCGYERDQVIGSSLVDMYAKCGSLSDAHKVCTGMPDQAAITWNTLISGYVGEGLLEEALSCFHEMELDGVLTDSVSWNTLLTGHCKVGHSKKAFECYAQMLEQGLLPNDAIFLNLLGLCGEIGALVSGKRLHSHIWRAGESHGTPMMLATALIDMYGKCGSMHDAEQIFVDLPKRDCAAWNALIIGFARQGETNLTFRTVGRMIQSFVQPNDITFVNVLTLCSHVGLVTKAQKYFELMSIQYGICPNIMHHTCIADLLARAGRLDEAVLIITVMPHQANIVSWRTIMGSCRNWGDIVLGRHAFECGVVLDKEDAATYIGMSNLYADFGIQEASVGT